MADNERTITTVFRADISNFSAATQQLNRNVANINSEFKNATASMGRWNDNTTGLQAKLKQLNGVLDQEKQRLQMLENQYAELVAQGKENTKEAQDLATAINNQGAKVKETKKNIDHYTASLKELEDAGVDTRQELEKLNRETEELENNANELGGGILKGAAVGVAGLATAFVGAFAACHDLVEESKELRTQMGQLETTFAQQKLGADAAKNTFNELVGVLGDTGKATEASMHLAQIAKNEKELVNYTNILTGVYATFGDSLPVEGLAEAINHTANLGSVQGVLADALEWSGVNVDDFNAELETLNTEEERAKLISDTLNGLYGETATKYKEVNSSVIEANKAQNEYNQTMAGLAEDVEPAITSLKNTAVGALKEVMPLVSGGINFLADNLPTVIGLMASLTAGIVAQTAATKIKALTDKAAAQGITLMKLAQQGLNAAFKANPIGFVVTAVGLLITAFTTLYKNCEGFRNFFNKMVNGMIKGVNALIKGLNKVSFKVPEWVPEIGGKKLGFNIPTIPLLAKGAVIDKPTVAVLGEAGKEVVMPLENNMQWLDKVATRLNAQGGARNVNYNVYNTFERMETTQHALHKANLELKRTLMGA